MEFATVNWLAVLVGAVAAFLLGWLIYSPKMFGTKWAEGSGIDPTPPETLPALAMGAQIVALLCLSTVIGVTATFDALITALLAILAAAVFVVSNGAFCQKSGYALAVDFGYVVAAGIVMIVAQGVF